MQPIGTKPNPVWMAITPRKLSVKETIMVMTLSLAPVAIALLMQKPALRQVIAMRAFHTTKVVSQEIADAFQVIATKSAQAYQKAQM